MSKKMIFGVVAWTVLLWGFNIALFLASRHTDKVCGLPFDVWFEVRMAVFAVVCYALGTLKWLYFCARFWPNER